MSDPLLQIDKKIKISKKEILKDYKKGYDDRTAYIKRQPSNMGFAQLAHYENIGYLIWLASSSALIVNSLFEKGVIFEWYLHRFGVTSGGPFGNGIP